MTLQPRHRSKMIKVLSKVRNGESASISVEDSLEVEQLLQNLSEGGDLPDDRLLNNPIFGATEKDDDVKADVWKKEVLVKAGSIPVARAKVGVKNYTHPQWGWHDVKLSFKYKQDIDDRFFEIYQMLKGEDIKIPEELAKYRQAETGSKEVDRNIDDFNDGLRALGINSIKFIPVENLETEATTQAKQGESGQKNTEKAAKLLNRPEVQAIVGIGSLIAATGTIYKVTQ